LTFSIKNKKSVWSWVSTKSGLEGFVVCFSFFFWPRQLGKQIYSLNKHLWDSNITYIIFIKMPIVCILVNRGWYKLFHIFRTQIRIIAEIIIFRKFFF